MKTLIALQILLLTSSVLADHITNIDNEKLILTCEDGPCNRQNLDGFECSYTKYNDNYKFVCLSDKTSFWNNFDYTYVDMFKDNFNKLFVGYFIFLITFIFVLFQLRVVYKLCNFILKI